MKEEGGEPPSGDTAGQGGEYVDPVEGVNRSLSPNPSPTSLGTMPAMIEVSGPNRRGEFTVRYTYVGPGCRATSRTRVNPLEFRYCGVIQGVLRVLRRCEKRTQGRGSGSDGAKDFNGGLDAVKPEHVSGSGEA